jgi:hypothetical protein
MSASHSRRIFGIIKNNWAEVHNYQRDKAGSSSSPPSDVSLPPVGPPLPSVGHASAATPSRRTCLLQPSSMLLCLPLSGRWAATFFIACQCRAAAPLDLVLAATAFYSMSMSMSSGGRSPSRPSPPCCGTCCQPPGGGGAVARGRGREVTCRNRSTASTLPPYPPPRPTSYRMSSVDELAEHQGSGVPQPVPVAQAFPMEPCQHPHLLQPC